MHHKNFFQRLAMPIPELERYYREQRKKRFKDNRLFRRIKIRKILHPILISGLKVIHLFKGQKITIIKDKSLPTNRPVIFAATHICWDDIEMIFSAIGKHAYLLWGDPRESYRSMDGFLLNLNGVIICNTDNKEDRYIAKESCVRWLEQGGNLLIFPEGVWNTSENQLVQYLFSGTAEMAIRTGADIVPIAIGQAGKEYRINIGKNISASGWLVEQKQDLTGYLRDVMATLKWEIYETWPVTERSSIPEKASEIYKQDFLNQAKGIFTWQDLMDTTFHPKNITTPEEAFSYFDKLIPCRENAFLLRGKK